MPVATCRGIDTYYEVVGDGPPLLMLAPGGFDAVTENWERLGVYQRIRPVEHLATRYTCVLLDRREAGRSGGRVERLTWLHYVDQAVGLLDHLGFDVAHVMGACVGCSIACAIAVAHPTRVTGMVLYSPAGGAKYRMGNQARFAQHLTYVHDHGLDGVVSLARETDKTFSKDPRVGPWAAIIRRDNAFADHYVEHDINDYATVVQGIARTMFDRDTVPGAEPEDLLRLDVPTLVVPGQDASHATSAARYLEECIPGAEYWDVPVADQTANNAPARLTEFLATADSTLTDH